MVLRNNVCMEHIEKRKTYPCRKKNLLIFWKRLKMIRTSRPVDDVFICQMHCVWNQIVTLIWLNLDLFLGMISRCDLKKQYHLSFDFSGNINKRIVTDQAHQTFCLAYKSSDRLIAPRTRLLQAPPSIKEYYIIINIDLFFVFSVSFWSCLSQCVPRVVGVRSNGAK